jgi:hypothetical protein
MTPQREAALTSLLGLVLVTAAFAMTAARAEELELNTRVPIWVVDAIPPALSELYYGHRKRYTSLESVQRRFYDQVPRENSATAQEVNSTLRHLEETSDEDPGPAYVLMGSDDKGIVDLVEGGFVLFGLRLESVITFYFALLLASCVVYVAAYWRSPSALLLLAAFLCMVYLIMPSVAYNPQLRSLLALRTLPILSMVACLHGLLFMATAAMRVQEGEGRVGVRQAVGGWRQISLVTAQALLLAFTIHLRSTTLWEVAIIVGFGGVLLAVAVLGERVRRIGGWLGWPAGRGLAGLLPVGVAVGVAGGLALAGVVGVKLYQSSVLPEEYQRGEQIATRNIWHNVFTGLAYHPGLRERYALRLDDVSIEAATRDWLIETGRLDEWLAIGGRAPDPSGNDAPSSFEGVKLAKYDPYVRDMLIARCSALVRECLETVLWYKPLSLVNNLAWMYGFRNTLPDLDVTESRYFGDLLKQQFLGMAQGVDGHNQRAYLWTPRVLLILAPFVVLLLAESRPRELAALWAALALAVGSTIPMFAGYAAPHTVGDPAVAFGMLVYFCLWLGLARTLRQIATILGLEPEPAGGHGSAGTPAGVRGLKSTATVSPSPRDGAGGVASGQQEPGRV